MPGADSAASSLATTRVVAPAANPSPATQPAATQPAAAPVAAAGEGGEVRR
jgi:hypothetical protein